MIRSGLTMLFRGARRGDAPLAALGAAMAILGWFRSTKPTKQRIYARTLRDGEAITIKLLRGDTVVGEQRVEG